MTALLAIAVGAAWTFLVYAAAERFLFRPRIERLRAESLAEFDTLERRLVKLERGER